MSPLQAGQTTTVAVHIGQILIISGSGGAANIIRISNPGGEYATPDAFSGVQKSYGPYDVLAIFRIDCTIAEVFYDVNIVSIQEAGIALTADTLNTQTGIAYIIQQSDAGKVVELDNAAVVTVTVSNGLSVGFNCILSQIGAGLVTVVAGSGATVSALYGLKSPGRWGEMSLRVRANAGGSAAQAVLGGGVA